MLLFPAADLISELPAINDIAVQYQTATVNMFKEIRHFFGPGMFRTQVNVRQDNGWIILSQFHVVSINTIQKNVLHITALQQPYEKIMKATPSQGQPSYNL